jgi:putative addiction module killer protein
VEARELEVRLYRTRDGKIPYGQWFDGIRSAGTQGRIETRIARLRLGNFGKCKALGGGITELILDFGPGYRIYVGQSASRIVLLLSVVARKRKQRTS